MKLQRWQVIGLAVGLAFTVRADVYVSPTGDDTHTGESWEQALATISNAVIRVGESGSVFVSNGVYDIDAEIVVTNGVALTGVGGGSRRWRSCLS